MWYELAEHPLVLVKRPSLRFHVDATQCPRNRFVADVNLFWFCVRFTSADQSQPLLLFRLDARLTFLGGVRQAVVWGRSEGPQGRNGSVNPPCVVSDWKQN